MRRSKSGIASVCQSEDEVCEGCNGHGNVSGLNTFRRVMAQAAFAAHKKHRHRTDRRERDGVVSRTADQ